MTVTFYLMAYVNDKQDIADYAEKLAASISTRDWSMGTSLAEDIRTRMRRQ